VLLQQVTLDDIRPIAVGAGILGTGGGGNPYLGSLHLRQVIEERGPQTILDPMALDDDALIVEVGGIGAPTVSIEKISEGTEMVRALRLLEKHLDRQFDAVVIAEIGGANAMQPLIAGLLAGIPNVDADSMGRAFPELQMSSFLFGSDAHVAPFAMVDAGVNAIVVPHTVSDVWSERIARNIAISFGARAGLAGTVMTGAQIKASCVPYTLTLACQLGNRVFAAQNAHEDVPEAIADLLQGRVIFRGKILDVDRRTTTGFARGSVTIQSFGTSDPLRIEFQNEFLVAYQGDTPLVTVPDLICIVAEDTGEPVTTELLRYGTRVAILGVPAAAALKTPTALDVVGPEAFGYNLEFKPLPGNSIGVLPIE
jgi:uncharacterized protein